MNDRFIVKFNTYQRRFRQPLQTNHGLWRVREGIIVSLIGQDGNIAQGEIAPLPWFGSETMAQALKFCQQLNSTITRAEIVTIADGLPACQFAFESALENLDNCSLDINWERLNYCYLLPTGNDAIEQIASRQNQQHSTTFKWKIGVNPIEEEIAELQQLVQVLPPGSKLRLDANGGLDITQARALLSATEEMPAIEFIEQPLPPPQFTEMLALSREYSTPLALDESVANCDRLQSIYQRGWRGIFVIKAAIMGYPSRLRLLCHQNSLDTVFSSVFETDIGRQAVLKLATTLSDTQRAVGFGVEHWFND